MAFGALALGAAAAVPGQSFQGGIRGTVRASGSVVPGVNIELINEGTNASRPTVTNSLGEYAFSTVVPGTYTLKSSMQGFKKTEHQGVRIGTQQFVTLDLALEVGSLQEAVEVVGGAPLVETSNASVGEVLDKRELEAIPTAGRNPFFLAITTPNVVPTATLRISFGSRIRPTRRALDWPAVRVAATTTPWKAWRSPTSGTARPSSPSIEAVEEVKVQVSTYDAEMGRTGGGVFNTIGPSGSNTWHGSALVQNRPAVGARAKLFFPKKRPAEAGHVLLPLRRLRAAARSCRTRRSSGRAPRATTQRPRAQRTS